MLRIKNTQKKRGHRTTMLISKHTITVATTYVADNIINMCAMLNVKHGMNLQTEKSIGGAEVTIHLHGKGDHEYDFIPLIDEALDTFPYGDIISYTKNINTPHTNKTEENATTSLIIVDLQNGFINHHTRHIIPRILDHINSGYNSVIATKFFVSEKFSQTTGFNMKKFSYGNNASLYKSIDGKFDTLIPKDTYGTQGRCAEALRNAGSTSAVIVGIDTEVCVTAIATELVDEGYDIHVDKMACASTGGLTAHRNGVSALSRIIHPSRLTYPVYVKK